MLRAGGTILRASLVPKRQWVPNTPSGRPAPATPKGQERSLFLRAPRRNPHPRKRPGVPAHRAGLRFHGTARLSVANPRPKGASVLFASSKRGLVLGGCCLVATTATALSVGVGWARVPATTECDGAVAVAVDVDERDRQSERDRPGLRAGTQTGWDGDLWSRIARALRVIARLFKLTMVFSPVLALYPLHWITSRGRGVLRGSGDGETASADAHELSLKHAGQSGGSSSPLAASWYYRLCLFCVEWSGAACIKTMQWAGSRPDMFGSDFCAVFSRLQDSTRPHSRNHTERAMAEAFGEEWGETMRLDSLLGSGCIAQVYKGVVLVDDPENPGQKVERPVAVKVRHPGVEKDIDADLDILRLVVGLLDKIDRGPVKNLRWLNLPGFIEEMAVMLKVQLDLRREGEHLVRFNENFEGNETVVFPRLVEGYAPTKGVLCETFHEGQPLMAFVGQNKADQKLLTKMCTEAVKAVCQMIFLDNFTHGDLHPGNVLVTDDYKFVLLDVGITTVHSEKDHKLLSDVLAAFIRKQGRKAGRYMIENSNARLERAGDRAVDEERFCDKIEQVTIAASGKDYFMEHLGTYITYICNSASAHHVMLNQAFISSALAVKVQEGIALALDPSIEIWRIAIPIILEGERRHGRVGERAREMLGIRGGIADWFAGTKPAAACSGD